MNESVFSANTIRMERQTTEHRCRDNRGRFTQCKDDGKLRRPKNPNIRKRTYWSVMSSVLALSTVAAVGLLSMTMARGRDNIAHLENEYNQQITGLTQQINQQDNEPTDPPKQLPQSDPKPDPKSTTKNTEPQELHGETA